MRWMLVCCLLVAACDYQPPGVLGERGKARFSPTLAGHLTRTPLAVGAGFNLSWEREPCEWLLDCDAPDGEVVLRSDTPAVVSGEEGLRFVGGDAPGVMRCNRDIDCPGGQSCVASVCCVAGQECGGDDVRRHDFVAERPGIAMLTLSDSRGVYDFIHVEVATPMRLSLTDHAPTVGFARALPADVVLASGRPVFVSVGAVDASGRVLQHHDPLVRADDLVREGPSGFIANLLLPPERDFPALQLEGPAGAGRLHLRSARAGLLDGAHTVQLVDDPTPEEVRIRSLASSLTLLVLDADARLEGKRLLGADTTWTLPESWELDEGSDANSTLVVLRARANPTDSDAFRVDVGGVIGTATWGELR